MLELTDALDYQVANHNCDDNRVCNRAEENYGTSISCGRPTFELVIDRISSRSCLKLKLRVACSSLQDRLVHELWEKNAGGGRSHVHVAGELVALGLSVCLKNLIRSVHVWLFRSLLDSKGKNSLRVIVKGLPRVFIAKSYIEGARRQILSECDWLYIA